MGRKKRVTAFVLSCILAAAPSGSVIAEELLIAETQEESAPEPCEEIFTDEIYGAEDDWAEDDAVDFEEDFEAAFGEEIFTEETEAAEESADDSLILSVEAVESPELETEPVRDITQFPEYFEGEANESGMAANASFSRLRSFMGTSYNGSYGAQLTGEAKELYDRMVELYVTKRGCGELQMQFADAMQFTTYEEAEEVSLRIDFAVQASYDAFKYDWPEVFWMAAPTYKSDVETSKKNGIVVGKVSVFHLIPRWYEKTADGKEPDMQAKTAEIAAFDAAVGSAVNQLVSELPSAPSMRDQVKAIHHYVCKKAKYPNIGNEDPSKNELLTGAHYSAAGVFLKNGSVVCEGYSKSVKILCRKFDINCALIVGSTSAGNHMWNYVQMDNGGWYLVDATWDDLNDVVTLSNYFLVGNRSTGFDYTEISKERLIYTNFSGSMYTVDFAVPVLSAQEYDDEKGHVHEWILTEEKQPTCQEGGFKKYKCELCGETTEENYDKTKHSFKKMITLYNGDATCVHDGTAAVLCDYGCGTKEQVITSKGEYVDRAVTAEGTKLGAFIKVSMKHVYLKKGQKTKKYRVTDMGKGDYVTMWKSNDGSVVRVKGKSDGTCTLTAQKRTGTAKLTVVLASGKKKTVTVTVQDDTVRTTKISGISKKLTLKRGEKKKLKPKLMPLTSGEKITYSSSAKTVASVSKSGVITAKRGGTAKITVRSGKKKAVMTVRVPKTKTREITKVPKAVTLRRGASKTLKPRLIPASSDYKITYRSSRKSVASVSKKGKIRAKKKGISVITVKSGSVSVQCVVTVQ